MRNPLRILKLLTKVRRPSKVGDMPAVLDSFWLRRNYQALTFFGFIVCRTEEVVQRLNEVARSNGATAGYVRPGGGTGAGVVTPADRQRYAYAIIKNHEMIHLRQAQACHNSWFCFYLLYSWYYLRALPQNRRLKNAAYVLNPFEMEAYSHQHDFGYLADKQDGTDGWRYYARLSPRERLRLKTQG